MDCDCDFKQIGGLSGCEDHNLVMGEVLNHAKTNGRTAHITWFDL